MRRSRPKGPKIRDSPHHATPQKIFYVAKNLGLDNTRKVCNTIATRKRAKKLMAYIEITSAKSLFPSQKIITENTKELFLDRLQEGFTFSSAAKALSLGPRQLKELLAKHLSEIDIKEAMRVGAEVLVDDASEALKFADSKEDIEKAKALAQHYRWLASKLNPAKFGDSIKVDGNKAPSYEFIVNIAAPQNTSRVPQIIDTQGVVLEIPQI